jgi:hypothetical protein
MSRWLHANRWLTQSFRSSFVSVVSVVSDLSDPGVVARKIKALSKKIRQITDLKEKQASGTELNEDQLQKVATEDQLNEEMHQLTLLAQSE